MVEQQVVYGLIGVMAAYIAVRWYLSWRTGKTTTSGVDRELSEVLNNDEYKVKGRFE